MGIMVEPISGTNTNPRSQCEHLFSLKTFRWIRKVKTVFNHESTMILRSQNDLPEWSICLRTVVIKKGNLFLALSIKVAMFTKVLNLGPSH